MREIACVAFHVQLKVQPQTARVPVGRAEQNPVPVHNHQLRVVKRRGREPETAAVFEHLPPHRARCPMNEGQIVFGRQNDVHAHAPQRGEVQRGNQRGVRQEIGRENLHGRLRLGQCGEQRPAQLFKIYVRTVRDDARNGVAATARMGKPNVAVEDFTGAKRPVVRESFLQLGDHRTSDAKVQVLDGAFRFVGEHVAAADVHAAGEGDFPVHDERLAVVAEVDGGHAPRRERRQKTRGVHAGVPQFVRDRRPRVARPGGVNQHAHFNAAADRPAKRLDELVSAGVVVENVG